MVYLPKKEGGLVNMTTHNDAMLLKFLHKFFNRSDIPWVNLVWENYYSNGLLPGHNKGDLFGGKILSNYYLNTKAWPKYQSRMELLCFSGMIFGMAKSQLKHILNCSPFHGFRGVCKRHGSTQPYKSALSPAPFNTSSSTDSIKVS